MSRAKKRLRADARAWILACGDGQRWDPPASVPRRMLVVWERTGGDIEVTPTGARVRERRALCSLNLRGLHALGQLRANRDADARVIVKREAERESRLRDLLGPAYGTRPRPAGYAPPAPPPLRPWATWCFPLSFDLGARVMVECLACGQRGRREVPRMFASSALAAARDLAEYHRTRCPARLACGPEVSAFAGVDTGRAPAHRVLWDRPCTAELREDLTRMLATVTTPPRPGATVAEIDWYNDRLCASLGVSREYLLGGTPPADPALRAASGSRTTEQSPGDGLGAGPAGCDSPGPGDSGPA